MPVPRTVNKHGGVAKVRMKRLSNGTMVRVYFYKDHKMFVDAMKKERERGKTKS